MLDFKKEIVSALKDILPTYYEDYRDSKMAYPCITYRESSNNQDSVSGKKIFFSNIGYCIKIWADKISDITDYAEQIDAALRQLDYYRSSSNELQEGNMLCKIMLYRTYAEEHIN